MAQPILIQRYGGEGGGFSQSALNFDYDLLRSATAQWKGTRSYRKAAEIIGIHHTKLRRFLNGGLVTWNTVQKLCAAMRRDEREFLR